MTERPRLDSWKEIARYFGRDVRTVIRWERRRGLPVHRVPGGKRGAVFAYPAELQDWLARGGAAPEPTMDTGPPEPVARFDAGHALIWMAAGVGIALLALAAAGLWPDQAGPLTELAVTGNRLTALDRVGRTIWTRALDTGSAQSSFGDWTQVGDLDADGIEDILASLELTGRSQTEHSAVLLRLSADGALQWSSTVDDRVTFRDGEYGPPWAAASLSVYRVGGQTRVAWGVHHYTWWPGLLVTLDAAGNRLETFVNSGWIRKVVPSADGRYLLVSGVTNSRHAYFLAVLDAAHPSGRSPEPPGSAFECLDCPGGHPVRYFVFPRTRLGRTQPFPADGPTVQAFEDGAVLVQVLATGDPNTAATIYEFSRELEVRSARFTNSFWDWHRRLEREGVLDHGVEACPDRLRDALDVESWTATGGWETLRVPVR